MTAEVLATVAELRARLVGIYGSRLSKLIIYGSHARGEAQAGSDIDVLVVLDGPVDPGDEIRRTSPVTAEISLRRDVVLYLDEFTFRFNRRRSRSRGLLLLPAVGASCSDGPNSGPCAVPGHREAAHVRTAAPLPVVVDGREVAVSGYPIQQEQPWRPRLAQQAHGPRHRLPGSARPRWPRAVSFFHFRSLLPLDPDGTLRRDLPREPIPLTLATHELGHQVLFNMTGTVEGAYPDVEEGVADAITAMVHADPGIGFLEGGVQTTRGFVLGRRSPEDPAFPRATSTGCGPRAAGPRTASASPKRSADTCPGM